MPSGLEGPTWDSFVSCYPITFPKTSSWDGKFGESLWAWVETGDRGSKACLWSHNGMQVTPVKVEDIRGPALVGAL